MNLKIYSSESVIDADAEENRTVAPTVSPTAASLTLESYVPTVTRHKNIEAIQRGIDIILTTGLLLVLLPLFLILAVIILADSRGPVLFKQKRVGKNGEEFWFYKFRSMVADAEDLRIGLAKSNEATGPMFKIKNDPRITRSGRWLRKYSLDELPQLINVMKGEMSLVGPRPPLPVEVAKYNERQRGRLAVLPGITGLWQVSGRSDLPFDRCVELDLQYIAEQSVPQYFKILVMTIPAVTGGKGAY